MKNNSILIDEFKNYLLIDKGLSKNTIEAYIFDIKKFIAYIEKKSINLENITLENLIFFFDDIKRAGLKQTSIARILTSLKNFFYFLKREKLIKQDIIQFFLSPKIKKSLPDFLTEQEIRQILNSFDLNNIIEIRNKAILETLYATGGRVSEICNLKLSDINLSERYLILFGKAGKERFVPIHRECAAILENYIKNIRKKNIKKPNDYVFLTNHGDKISRKTIWLIVKKQAQKCNINKNIKVHSIRHSFATHLLSSGAGLRTVQTLLGHSDISTTQIYTHISKIKQIKDFHKMFHPRGK